MAIGVHTGKSPVVIIDRPRYDLRGWLGVKNQLSIYLSIYLSTLLPDMCRYYVVVWWVKDNPWTTLSASLTTLPDSRNWRHVRVT